MRANEETKLLPAFSLLPFSFRSLETVSAPKGVMENCYTREQEIRSIVSISSKYMRKTCFTGRQKESIFINAVAK